MKKVVLFSLLASMSTMAVAGTGVYVQGDVGYSKLTGKTDKTHKDNDKIIKISAGKDLNNWRWAVDYTNYGSVTTEETRSENGTWAQYTTVSSYDSKIKNKVQSVGLGAFYDFETMADNRLTPYIGVRAGLNEIKSVKMTTVDAKYFEQNGDFVFSQKAPLTDVNKNTKFGAGVQAGVHYAFNENLGLDWSVEYNHLGKIEGVKFDQYGTKLGVRYTF